jgi:hypothetical protein
MLGILKKGKAMILQTFTHNGEFYQLSHDLNDDSRTVYCKGVPKVFFDSHLGIGIFDQPVKAANPTMIGRMFASEQHWKYSDDGDQQIVLLMELNDFHYKTMENAEIKLAKHLIEQHGL